MFLLPAFTRLGNGCENLLSPCDRMHVCRDWTSVYSLIRKSSFLRNVVGTYVNSKGKITSTGGSEECQTRDAALRRNHLSKDNLLFILLLIGLAFQDPNYGHLILIHDTKIC